MTPESVPGDFERVLVVGAHPDDAEFFAGGTLATLARAGVSVGLVVCTDGSLGGRGIDDTARVRREEQRAAADALGIGEVTHLDHADGALEPGDELRRQLVREIRRQRPELVLGHDPRTLWTRFGRQAALGHSDHRAAGRALLDALYPRGRSPNFYRELDLEPWWPRELWLFDTQEPDWLADVSNGWEPKLAALRRHESQAESGGGLLRLAEALARRLGSPECPAEAFVRLELAG
jgi:LmbE family N-acetylglucosaminyl deacetylase